MGTHPIFESDFDCLTDLKSNFVKFGGREIIEMEILLGSRKRLIDQPECLPRQKRLRLFHRAEYSLCHPQQTLPNNSNLTFDQSLNLFHQLIDNSKMPWSRYLLSLQRQIPHRPNIYLFYSLPFSPRGIHASKLLLTSISCQ